MGILSGKAGIFVLMAASVIALTGCEEDIIFGVPQSEAIKIVVVLGDSGINATSAPDVSDKEQLFKIRVDEADAFDAKKILLENRLPRVKPRGMNEVFAEASMIPTATEERARLLVGLQGDLEGSLEAVDHIVDAEVHIVLPEANPLESDLDRTKARASALIRHQQIPQTIGGDEFLNSPAGRVLANLSSDLNKLNKVTEDLEDSVASDLESVKKLKEALATLRDADSNKGRKAVAEKAADTLNKSIAARREKVVELQNLPKVKSLPGVLTKIRNGEASTHPMEEASIQSLIANAVPRLAPSDVAVEFFEVPKPDESGVARISSSRGVSKPMFMIVAGAAAVMTALAIGLGVWSFLLQRKLKAATTSVTLEA
jgi:type III secretion system YscJ/HrcJ family lipoprotein